MAAVVQICDAHLTDGFEVGTNITDSTITDILKEVRYYNQLQFETMYHVFSVFILFIPTDVTFRCHSNSAYTRKERSRDMSRKRAHPSDIYLTFLRFVFN